MPLVTSIFKAEMIKSGHEMNNNLCPHFTMSRAELYSVVKYVIPVYNAAPMFTDSSSIKTTGLRS